MTSAGKEQGMAGDEVLFEVADGVAIVTINRPERLNAVNGAVLDGLGRAFDRIDTDLAIRVAVLTATGTRAFTAGIDLVLVQEDEEAFRRFVERELVEMYARVARLRTPVVAAVEGIAYATGSELLFYCDIVYAGQGARFCFPDLNLGLGVTTPIWGATDRLNRTRLA